MIKYKNVSNQILTFYGISFNPGDIKEVPGFINHIKMIRIKQSSVVPTPKAVITLPKEVTAKSEEQPKKRQYTRRKTQ